MAVQDLMQTDMIARFRKLLGAPDARPAAAIPPGQRVYALGDVHGRADLLAALIHAVETDDAGRDAASTTVILLGDLVDRGPDSAGVIRLAREWQARRGVRFLMGNHEEMFLDSFTSTETLRHFLRYGGRETLLSYPIDPAAYARAEIDTVQVLMRESVPADDLDFLRTFEDQIAIGDYLFVHAGIRPEVPLSEQDTSDLRWIRGTFLDHQPSFGPVVVHGHTIYDRPEVRSNRIGIDTGAFASGRLTALGLEGTARWTITAHEHGGVIRVTQGSIG